MISLRQRFFSVFTVYGGNFLWFGNGNLNVGSYVYKSLILSLSPDSFPEMNEYTIEQVDLCSPPAYPSSHLVKLGKLLARFLDHPAYVPHALGILVLGFLDKGIDKIRLAPVA